MCRRRRAAALGALVAVLLATAAASAAAGPARSEYVTRLERICKPGALATQRVMRGARADLRRERLQAAATKFGRGSSIFESTVRRIAAVPRPPADRQRLGRWFVFLKRQGSYLRRITRQLRGEHAIAAQRLTARFIHNGNLANNVVLGFGFDYCSFKFSRYG